MAPKAAAARLATLLQSTCPKGGANSTGEKGKEARKHACAPPRHRLSALVVIAVDLLEEGLGVEGVGRAGDAGDDRKRNQGGQDGLHGNSP